VATATDLLIDAGRNHAELVESRLTPSPGNEAGSVRAVRAPSRSGLTRHPATPFQYLLMTLQPESEGLREDGLDLGQLFLASIPRPFQRQLRLSCMSMKVSRTRLIERRLQPEPILARNKARAVESREGVGGDSPS